jgi:hypothetical protein
LSTHDTSVSAAFVFSGVFHDAPGRPNASVVIWSAGTNRSCTVPNTWIPGHLSRLPNCIGTSPAAFAFASASSNSAHVFGGCTPSLVSFSLL